MRSTEAMLSVGAASPFFAATETSSVSLFGRLATRLAIIARDRETSRNAGFGNPGIRHIAARTPLPMYKVFERARSCVPNSAPSVPEEDARVSTIPPATETSSDGIIVTSPSPTVNRIGPHGSRKIDSLLQYSDQQAGDNIDRGDQDRGQSVALVETRSLIHRSVELSLVGNFPAPLPCRSLVDQARVHVSVNRPHLLARQRVQREAGRNLRCSHSMADDEKLNCDQRQEEHESDNIVAADNKLFERLNHLAGRRRALASMEKDATARRDIQATAKERQQQEQRGKHGRDPLRAEPERRKEIQ